MTASILLFLLWIIPLLILGYLATKQTRIHRLYIGAAVFWFFFIPAVFAVIVISMN